MKRFRYKAKDKEGKVINGEVEASSENHAAKLVRERDLVVISIKRKGGGLSIFSGFNNRITFGQVVIFTRQLSTMVNAGLPITESLLIMRNQSKGGMQKAVSQILADVEGGEALSVSMAKHPKVFSTTYVALVKSGEVGGVLAEVLVKLSDNMEKQQEFRAKVVGALIYPVIIVIGMVGVALIMMIFVIPKLLSLYNEFDAELPMPTKILMGISGVVAKFWPIIFAIVAGLAYSLFMYRKTEAGKLKTDGILLKIPLLGPLLTQIILTDLTRTLSMMVGAGVSILEGLNISAEVVNNAVMSNALKGIAKDVEKGFPVAYSFSKRAEVFPYILSQMIAVGEETGKMDEVLQKLSHIFEVESDQKVKSLTAAIEPLVMVVLGIGVGFLVIAVILPIYNLTSQF